jgi:hypothetical protein
MTREMLEGDTFSKDHSVQVRSISCSCFEALQDLQNAIDKFKAMPKYSQTSWNRIGFEFSNFAEIEKRLQSTISMVTDLNQTLSRCNIHVSLCLVILFADKFSVAQ